MGVTVWSRAAGGKRTALRCAFWVWTAAFMAACGGGGGGGSPTPSNPVPTFQFSGTAATGAPMAGAAVVASCKGATATQRAASDGRYTLTVTNGQLPCMLQATPASGAAGTPLHSYVGAVDANNKATVNATPITDAALAAALSSGSGQAADLKAIFSTYSSNQANQTLLSTAQSNGLMDQAVKSVLAQLEQAGVDTTSIATGNPFTQVFAADRTGYDKVMDDMQVKNLSVAAISKVASQALAIGQQVTLGAVQEAVTAKAIPSGGSTSAVGVQLTLSGSLKVALQADDKVMVFDNGKEQGQASVTGTTWTYTTPASPTLANGLHTFRAMVVRDKVQSAPSGVWQVNVAVPTYSVGGAVSGNGISALTLALKDANGQVLERLSTAAILSFSFNTKITAGSVVSVAVETSPSGLNCFVKNPNLTVTSDVTSLNVQCGSGSYPVTTAISGLTGTGLTLSLNGATSVPVASNGNLTLTQSLPFGTLYTVSVVTSPAGLTCTVNNGTDNITAAVTNVTVSCAKNTYTVGGSITGLQYAGLGLKLTYGAGLNETLAVASEATGFSFTKKPVHGDIYKVELSSQPTGQTCTLSGASGGSITANVNNISVNCALNTFNVGGTITGLTGAGLQLKLGYFGADYVVKTTVSSGLSSTATGFTFPTKLEYGAFYAAEVLAQPTGQVCEINSDDVFGLVTAAVNTIAVSCTKNAFNVSGRVEGLTSDGLKLRLTNKTAGNSSEASVLANATTFQFPTTLQGNPLYAVTVAQQPSDKTCVVRNALGAVRSADVTNVAVLCSPPNNVSNRYKVERVEVAQALSLPMDAPYLRVTPKRDLLVRAYVAKTNAQEAQPVVKVQLKATAPESWTDVATMACPTIATSSTPAPSYNLSQTCYATVPATAVQPGMALRVLAGDATYVFAPPVITPYKISIVVVPLTIGGITPDISAADLTLMQNHAQSRMPFAEVSVTKRASSLAPTGISSASLSLSSDWSSLLTQINTARIAESDGKVYYYGMAQRVPTPASGGIGYMPGFAAVGLKGNLSFADGVNYDLSTFIHELGHNLSLKHAPCGNPTNPDLSYPHTDGALSNAPLYVQSSKSLITPSTLSRPTDVMGYCSGTWFSDYSYAKMQDYMLGQARSTDLFGQAIQANTVQPEAAFANAAASSAQTKLLVSGVITGNGSVTLEPVQASTAPALSANSGSYSLRLYTQDNQALAWNFEPLEVADIATPTKHFHVVVPDLGTLAAVEVWQGNKLLLTQGLSAAQRAEAARNTVNSTAPTSRAAVAVQPALINAQEANGELRIQWNAAAWPNLQVIHDDAKGKKFVLTLGAQGGDVRLPLKDVTAGGWFDLSFSNGLQVQRSRVAR